MTWINYFLFIKGTVINCLFLVHPLILKTTMQMFACTLIEDRAYLDVYMEDECWVGRHADYAIVVAMPSTLLWGFGLPIAAFGILYWSFVTNTLNDH